ncbi:TPA: hypothetical protein I8P26_003247 [Salmonella enterica subsp. enterica serovar Napoli]|nr:hypothetical protein [Salmonella enterica subsp. enterica serovar Napoli]
MSQQVENAVTSSSKRVYRKGNPLTGAEKPLLNATEPLSPVQPPVL